MTDKIKQALRKVAGYKEEEDAYWKPQEVDYKSVLKPINDMDSLEFDVNYALPQYEEEARERHGEKLPLFSTDDERNIFRNALFDLRQAGLSNYPAGTDMHKAYSANRRLVDEYAEQNPQLSALLASYNRRNPRRGTGTSYGEEVKRALSNPAWLFK